MAMVHSAPAVKVRVQVRAWPGTVPGHPGRPPFPRERDLAYTVVFEKTSCSVNGEPRSYRLRATHTYRREDGEWRIVHRHADEPPQG